MQYQQGGLLFLFCVQLEDGGGGGQGGGGQAGDRSRGGAGGGQWAHRKPA